MNVHYSLEAATASEYIKRCRCYDFFWFPNRSSQTLQVVQMIDEVNKLPLIEFIQYPASCTVVKSLRVPGRMRLSSSNASEQTIAIGHTIHPNVFGEVYSDTYTSLVSYAGKRFRRHRNIVD
jgi:hypothetical protein